LKPKVKSIAAQEEDFFCYLLNVNEFDHRVAYELNLIFDYSFVLFSDLKWTETSKKEGESDFIQEELIYYHFNDQDLRVQSYLIPLKQLKSPKLKKIHHFDFLLLFKNVVNPEVSQVIEKKALGIKKSSIITYLQKETSPTFITKYLNINYVPTEF